jgi:hypothetical protein
LAVCLLIPFFLQDTKKPSCHEVSPEERHRAP